MGLCKNNLCGGTLKGKEAEFHYLKPAVPKLHFVMAFTLIPTLKVNLYRNYEFENSVPSLPFNLALWSKSVQSNKVHKIRNVNFRRFSLTIYYILFKGFCIVAL